MRSARNRRRPFTLATTIVLATCGAAHPPSATAADAVVDAGPVVIDDAGSVMVASGRGWGVWAHRNVAGAIELVAAHRRTAPILLPGRPLRRLDDLDVGAGPAGTATLVYRGCRERCGYYRIELASGRETRVGVPAPPEGCRHGRPVIDRAVYVVLAGRRCRAGLYEVRGGRLRRRQAGRLESYDIERGRLAMRRMGDDNIARITVRRLGRRRARLVYRDVGALYNAAASHQLVWDGGRLWIGLTSVAEDGASSQVLRIDMGRVPVCNYDPRAHLRRTVQRDLEWMFFAGRVLYTEREGGSGAAIHERTDPPPRYRSCGTPGASSVGQAYAFG